MRLLSVLCAVLLASVMAVDPARAQQRRPLPEPADEAVRPGQIPTRDAAGTRDAAALPRYADAILLGAYNVAFDDVTFANAPLEQQGDRRDGKGNRVFLPPAPLRVEGRRSRLVYLLPDGRSPLEVLRGYQQVVRDAGGAVLFECRETECGGAHNRGATAGGGLGGLITLMFPSAEVPSRPGHPVGCATETLGSQRYTLLALPNDGGHAAVLTYTLRDVVSGSECRAWSGRSIAIVLVVEAARREQRMQTVSAAAVGQGLAREGRVALYSILFDTGRAEIKPESAAQITELAAYLRTNPEIRALVVGHTDNQGGFEYNVDLSRRRAAAVVQALTREAIAPSRLAPAGVGMASPLASNDGEEGRARNRRVELVKQ